MCEICFALDFSLLSAQEEKAFEISTPLSQQAVGSCVVNYNKSLLRWWLVGGEKNTREGAMTDISHVAWRQTLQLSSIP